GIFDIANGAPLTPLQILWINFAVDVLLAIGLGFDAPAPGLMQRRPRDASAPIVDRALGIRLGVASLLMAVLALGVVAWGDHRYDRLPSGSRALQAPRQAQHARSPGCRCGRGVAAHDGERSEPQNAPQVVAMSVAVPAVAAEPGRRFRWKRVVVGAAVVVVIG